MRNWGWIGDYAHFRARFSPEKEAIYDLDTDTHYTYADLEDRANILANYLAETLHIHKWDRVAFLTRNCIELFDAYYATAKLGAIFVPYNFRLSVTELAELIRNEQPNVLFYEEFFKETAAGLKAEAHIGQYVVLSNAAASIDFFRLLE